MLNNPNRGRERGQTLIVAALVMAAVMGFTALAIDVGLLLEERRDNQNDADAVALAGVQYLPQSPSTAIGVATEWATKNGVAAGDIVTIEVQSTNVANDTLYVELSTEFSWIFGRVMGQTTSDVPAKAKAVVGSLGGNNRMMPWALLEGDSDCLEPGGDAIFGATCSVKVGADSSAITGWYGALDFDGNGGGSAEYEANIIDSTTDTRYCVGGDTSPGCVSSVSVVDALTGNKVGGTDDGIETRMAEGGTPCDTDSSGKDDFDEIFQDNPGPGAAYTVICESPRLVIIPIVSYSSTPVQTVTIQGWTLAYLDTYSCVGNCAGQGHWEVQIQIVDAVYAQSTGFITAYQGDGGITLRRLVE
jgi:hypothetical protein